METTLTDRQRAEIQFDRETKEVYNTDPRLGSLRQADIWLSAIGMTIQDNANVYRILASLAAHAKRAILPTTAAESAQRSLQESYTLLQSTVNKSEFESLSTINSFKEAVKPVIRQ